ncbi:MAG TPA: ABC transporter permease [Cyclobacteriaceae bacterium]|nr:ABC transporter permease [Cyclobacteriaceae bacterium]
MRALLILLEKEFRQIFRNPAILRIMFIMPSVQLLIMPLAADYEVKNVNVCVVDYDRSQSSQRLIQKITSTEYFTLVDFTDSYDKALLHLEDDEADLVLQIGAGFERDLMRENKSTVFLAINAVNGTKANIGGAYLRTVINDFNQDIRMEWISASRQNLQPTISLTSSNWYNPLMNYRFFMVPGILVILVTMVGGFLSALNIVKEKEVGTLEQINVTPIKKHQFILGKLIPFWILGLIVLTIGLTIARLVYGIIPVGSLFTIYAFAAVYLIAVLGMGLLVSTFANTQQQAMLLSFFMMMVFILLGGLFTSIDSMPEWAQVIARINPVSHFIEVMRMVVLKGSNLHDIRHHLAAVLLFGLASNGLAVWNYRKRN